MVKIKKSKQKIKSNFGFTMTDLVIAVIIFIIFSGITVTAFYSVYLINSKTRITAVVTNYTILILEDIDKMKYDEVKNGIEDIFIEEYSIPSGYNLEIDVSNYNDGNSKEDLIKNVKLSIEYKIAGETQKIVINKIKVKEL